MSNPTTREFIEQLLGAEMRAENNARYRYPPIRAPSVAVKELIEISFLRKRQDRDDYLETLEWLDRAERQREA